MNYFTDEEISKLAEQCNFDITHDVTYKVNKLRALMNLSVSTAIQEVGIVTGDSSDATGKDYWNFYPNDNWTGDLFNDYKVYTVKEIS